ncbi:MAG: MobF family relaxase [Gammaproteobacteria bacterium]
MLSTQVIKNISQASHYFLGQDNYYTQDSTAPQEKHQWWGKGAELLELSGSINSQQFTELLYGKLPNGTRLGKVEDGQIKHRPGFDLTFSAPKSVSMLALMGGDNRILKAVETATSKALGMIEEDLAKARITQAGVTSYQKTGNLVVARFLHDVSREGDPQLHTHCVVLNMTQRSDGNWRALASQRGQYVAGAPVPEGVLEAVRHHKKYYGAIFRAELAYEMTQLGYQVVKGENSFFEVAGISAESLKVFSQRRQEIEAFMKVHDFTGAKAAAMATLETRRAKEVVESADLMERWRSKAKLFSVPAFEEVKNTVLTAQKNLERFSGASARGLVVNTSAYFSSGASAVSPTVINQALAQTALKSAIEHLSETRVALRESEIIHRALSFLPEPLPVAALLKSLDQVKQSGELIPLAERPEFRGIQHFTTSHLIQLEEKLLTASMATHPSQKALVNEAVLQKYLVTQPDLTTGQQAALAELSGSSKQFLILEGAAGVGKTHLLKPLMEIGKLGGYKPLLLTASKNQSVELNEAFKTVPHSLQNWVKSLFEEKTCDTVAGFLAKQASVSTLEAKLTKKPLLLIDNANLLSLRQLSELTHHTQRLGGRLVLLDDSKSLLNWQAGSPFTQLIEKGATTIHLTQIAEHSNEKNNTQIFSVADPEERRNVMAAHYANLSPIQRKNTLVLMPTKAGCAAMNLAIRAELQQLGEINKAEVKVPILSPRAMTAAEQRCAASYQTGQWVQFQSDYVSLGVQQGDYRQIAGIDKPKNLVLFKKPKRLLGLLNTSEQSAKTKAWNPAQVAVGKISVFDADTRSVSVGDTLVWRHTNKNHRLYNGSQLKIQAIDEKHLTVQRLDHKNSVIKLDLQQLANQHFDYGYAFTPYSQYHSKPENIIAYQSASSKLSHNRGFYKLLNQAKEKVWVYTEDKHQLLQTLQKNSGDKFTAMDAVVGREINAVSHTAEHLAQLKSAVQTALGTLFHCPTPAETAAKAVDYALKHLSEREAAFNYQNVVKLALQQALGGASATDIQKALSTLEANGEIIKGMYSQDGERWTTLTALNQEKAIIQLAQAGQGQLPNLITQSIITEYLPQNPTLSDEQHKTLESLAEVKDRTVLIQGFAGTRKTTLLQHVQTLLNTQGQELYCLAPTHTAVKELKNRGLFGQTLASFLSDYQMGKINATNFTAKLIAVDESSMVSNAKLHDFLQAVNKLGIRCLMLGDTRQYPAIEAGKPFTILQKANVQTLYLTDITRQTNPVLKKAVASIYRKEFAAAFKTLAPSIIEIPNQNADVNTVKTKPDPNALSTQLSELAKTHPELKDIMESERYPRLEAICTDYLSRDPTLRSKTLIVTLGNEERIAQNMLIREGLKLQGELTGEAHKTHVLISRNLTETERTQVSNYRTHDILRFNLGDPSVGINKDEYWQVEAVHAQKNCLELRQVDAPNRITLWQLPPKSQQSLQTGVEVYQLQQREIQCGDLIRWTRTNKELGLFSAELTQVTKINDGQVTLQRLNITAQGFQATGIPIELPIAQAKCQHWDHAYAITGYSAQGKTIEQVIIHAESYRPQLTSQPSLLVAMTRAVKELVLYTDDKGALLEAMQKNAGTKISALETIEEFHSVKNNGKMVLPKYKDYEFDN